MATPINPLADRILATKEQSPTQTTSGLYLPETSKAVTLAAVVEAVGPDVKAVKPGDRIVYKEYSPSEVKVGDVEYILVKEEDVLATFA